MSSLVFLLLCLSLHATSARYLGVTDLETNKGFQVLGRGLEEEKPHKTWIPSSVKPFFSEGIHKQVKQVGKNDETGVHESWGGTNFINQKDRNAHNKVVGGAGYEVMASSAKEVLPEATKIEVWKKQARRMLGSVPNDAEETVDSKGNDVVEIVVMDYAQPHRKPPIHNKEP